MGYNDITKPINQESSSGGTQFACYVAKLGST